MITTINVYKSSVRVKQFTGTPRKAWKDACSYVRWLAGIEAYMMDSSIMLGWESYFGQGWYQTANRQGYGVGPFRATQERAIR